MIANTISRGGRWRHVWMFSVAALVALSMFTGCSPTPSPRATVTSATGATTISATASPASSAFVCPIPSTSNVRYAYITPDHQMTLAQGCAARADVTARAGRTLAPLAFSPSGRWLLASEGNADGNAPESTLCETLVDATTHATTLTPLCNPGANDPSKGWYGFIGWASDSTFYEAHWGVGSDAGVAIQRVTLPTFATTTVTTLAWVANDAYAGTPSGIALRGDALYYGGYTTASNHTTAWLRRYSLTTGADVGIMALGYAGPGGCQVQVGNAPCGWTGPWDITTDGGKIAFHAPGPTQPPSDISVLHDTPLYVAKSDGTGATRVFPNEALGPGLSGAQFSPDGRYLASGYQSEADQTPDVRVERLAVGAVLPNRVAMAFTGWTPQPGVAVVFLVKEANDALQRLALLNVESGTVTRLQPGCYDFVFAHAS